MKKYIISLVLASALAFPTVGFAQIADEIVQLNNLQITEVITQFEYSPGDIAIIKAVSNGDIRCFSYTYASFAYPCQPQVAYTIRVKPDTILLQLNRSRASLGAFAVGDTINVYGFLEENLHTVNALIMRDLSKPVTRYYTQVNNLTVSFASANQVIANQYQINLSANTKLLYRDRRIMPVYEIQAGDTINVYGLFNPANNTFDAVILRDMSKPGITPPPPQGNLSFTVATDKAVYNQDENIAITLRAYNNSGAARVLQFNSGCQVSYVIEGYYDQSQNRACTLSLTSVIVPAYGTYAWTTTHSPSAYRLQPGSYRLTDTVSGYGSATTTFTVSGSTSGNNQAPVITSISGPSLLNINQTGTWFISAYDPDNNSNNLTYSVDWGDPYNYAYGSASMAESAMQTGTFTHSYLNAGNYTVKFTVRDSSGLSAVSTLTVSVR